MNDTYLQDIFRRGFRIHLEEEFIEFKHANEWKYTSYWIHPMEDLHVKWYFYHAFTISSC